MLCSNCSHEVKPVVAIDVDGTLGDYHGHFLRFATNYLYDDDKALNLQLLMSRVWYGGEIPFSEYVCRALNIDIATYRQIKLAYRQGGMKRTMPIFRGASALCNDVRNAGAELWITTTRPYLSLDNIVPDTVEWCRRHSIEYDGMLFDEDKYSQLAERVSPGRVIAVLDDLPEMYDAAYRIFSSHPLSYYVPMLIDGQFNTAVERFSHHTLQQANDIVLKRIEWWKEEYHA